MGFLFLTLMSAISSVYIFNHTTSSVPQPHIVYIINVVRNDGRQYEVLRRYSEFVTLKENLGDSFPLPPKHTIATSFFPLAWVDNELIEGRKRGLQMYLTCLIHDVDLRIRPDFLFFLSAGDLVSPSSNASPTPVLLEMASKSSLASSNITIDNEPDKVTKLVAAAYYASWASDSNPPHAIDFSKFDILFFAFATPNNSAGINWEDGSKEVLKTLVACARNSGHPTKIVLSVGGWSGCRWYSQTMSTASSRSKFIKTLEETVNTYGLDGIDIDWEYPNASGAGNPHSSADAANLLDFFKVLRTTLGNSKIISAAVAHLPWLGEKGSPLSDVAEYAKYISFVNIMNYDVYSSSAHPGPNAPLGNGCGTSRQPEASAKAALTQWTRAGMPASKLLLGLALYGYVSKSTDKKLSGSAMPSGPLHGNPHPRYQSKTELASPQGDLSKMWGQQIPFVQLVQSGALLKNKEGIYCAANGYTMGWDDCSDTPYLFNVGRTTVVSYDDTFSIASKTAFAKESGMGGCFTWSLDQDDGTALHDVILHNLGRGKNTK